MFRRSLFSRCVASSNALGASTAAGASALDVVSSAAPIAVMRTSVINLEFWEQYRKLSILSDAESTHVRLLCPDELAAKVNSTVPMRFVLEQFLSRADEASYATVAERGWWRGTFLNTKSFNRRLLLELLLADGWTLQHVDTVVSEREWHIQSYLLLKAAAVSTTPGPPARR